MANQLQLKKEQFITALRETNRRGMDDLINYLENQTDFFTAPASASNHGAYEGGLLIHSLEVYKYLQNFTKPISDEVPADSIAIAALLHDLCKANFYAKRLKNVKDPVTRQWREEEVYVIEDSFPMGHGEKSAFLAQKYIDLTDDEALAIRWHMGGFDDSARQYAGSKALALTYDKCKLAVALSIADLYVAQIVGA